MHVVLFVLDVCMLRECEGTRVTAMLVWGTGEVWLWWVQGMSTWVIHLVQILCLAQLTCLGWEELVECVKCVFGSGRCRRWLDNRIGFGLYESCKNRGSVGCVSVFGLRWWCMWGVVRELGSGSGRVVLYLCELRILGAPSVQSCCTLLITASYRVFVYDRYRKSRLVCVLLSELDLSRHQTP